MPVDNGSHLMRPFRSRSRRGCLTCRQQRLKCDENGPRCGNCSRLDRHCRWGLKASFHPSRIVRLSPSDSTNLSRIESGRCNANNFAFIDDTQDIVREYTGRDEVDFQHNSGGADDGTSRNNQSHSPEITGERYAISSTTQNVRLSRSVRNRVAFLASEVNVSESESLSNVRLARILNPEPPPIPDQPTYTARSNISIVLPKDTTSVNPLNHSSGKVLAWPINDHMKAGLLASYFRDTSRWCEVTNSSNPFSTTWSHLVIEAQVFGAAAVALASIKSLRGNGTSTLLARELYDFARETLRYLGEEHHEGTLFATTLLCMYCSASEKTVEEQFILLDCASLLQATNAHNISSSVLSACFWAFARQDIWAAYSAGRSTLIPISTWMIGQEEVPQSAIQDAYSNQAIYITAQIINELSGQCMNMNEARLQNLWTELQTWVIERPQPVRCIMEVEASGDSAFPTILFSSPSAVCGNIYYHVASILLLATGKISDESSAMASPVCHARRAVGISITNNDHANLVNNIHLVCVAARYVPTGVERSALLKHLKEIEVMTGWRTTSPILELERLWGL